MSYRSPPPKQISGGEAIKHIQQAVQCSTKDAVAQLHSAIANHAVSARIHDERRFFDSLPSEFHLLNWTGPGSSPMVSPGIRSLIPWKTANIRADGTVAFGPGQRHRFWVSRENVVRIWPITAEPPVKTRKGPAPGTLQRYDKADRALFPELERLITTMSLSPWAAALKLAEDGKVAGTGAPLSRAKRLVALYNKRAR